MDNGIRPSGKHCVQLSRRKFFCEYAGIKTGRRCYHLPGGGGDPLFRWFLEKTGGCAFRGG